METTDRCPTCGATGSPALHCSDGFHAPGETYWPVETTDLVERLRLMAKQASDIARQMAEDKSLRQESNVERRTDLYMWATPDQTIEGRAAAAITALQAKEEKLEGALTEIRRIIERHPETIFAVIGGVIDDALAEGGPHG